MGFEVEEERTVPDGVICLCKWTDGEKRLVRTVRSEHHQYLGERCYVESFPDPTEPISLTFGPTYLIGVPPDWLEIIDNEMEILAWASK